MSSSCCGWSVTTSRWFSAPASGHPDVELVAAGRVGDSAQGGVDGERLDAGLGGGVTQLEVFVGVAVGECRRWRSGRRRRAVIWPSGVEPVTSQRSPLRIHCAVGSDDAAVVPAGGHDVTHPDGGVPLAQHRHAGLPIGVASCGDLRVDVGYETAGWGR